MLVSFDKKFIFLKASKAASTSTEAFFQQWCQPPGEPITQAAKGIIHPQGMIAGRGPNRGEYLLGAHSPAQKARRYIRSHFDGGIWDDYFKFTTVRNPWDAAVSAYFHRNPKKKYPEFKRWVKRQKGIFFRDHYAAVCIKGECVLDDFIRFENLEEDIRRICGVLKIELPEGTLELPTYRTTSRPESARDYTQFYDDETQEVVRKANARYIEAFGYEFGK